MLAALLGEASVLAGSVIVPRPLPEYMCPPYRVTAHNWLLPSSIAYISQVPWLENATIRDNILFGLPCVPVRYREVLDACALVGDMQSLPDAHSTEIGASGVNLSGGQRWRVTLARALYSRAGILILDDIFSAVDVQVGRHLLEQGLVGNLGIGRTRVLITHHIDMVRPFADFVVQLEDGGYHTDTRHCTNAEPFARFGTIPDSQLAAGNSLSEQTPNFHSRTIPDWSHTKETHGRESARVFVQEE